MRVEVLGGLERRRRWSQDDRVRSSRRRWRLGPKVTEVARRNGVAASVVFTWRRQARTVARVEPCFAPVQIAAAITGEDKTKPQSAPVCCTSHSTEGERRRVRIEADPCYQNPRS